MDSYSLLPVRKDQLHWCCYDGRSFTISLQAPGFCSSKCKKLSFWTGGFHHECPDVKPRCSPAAGSLWMPQTVPLPH